MEEVELGTLPGSNGPVRVSSYWPTLPSEEAHKQYRGRPYRTQENEEESDETQKRKRKRKRTRTTDTDHRSSSRWQEAHAQFHRPMICLIQRAFALFAQATCPSLKDDLIEDLIDDEDKGKVRETPAHVYQALLPFPTPYHTCQIDPEETDGLCRFALDHVMTHLIENLSPSLPLRWRYEKPDNNEPDEAFEHVLPPASGFILGTLQDAKLNLAPLLTAKRRFDLLLLDPPWPNRSARRHSGYQECDMYDLFHLPIAALCAENAIVAVWCTNAVKVWHFLVDTFCPAQRLRPFAIWWWVKTALNGELVLPLQTEQMHRHPYEGLLLARFDETLSSSRPTLSAQKTQKKMAPDTLASVPTERIFFSPVPTRHSQKPDLLPLFAKEGFWHPATSKGLEFFARAYRPGFIVWGDQLF